MKLYEFEFETILNFDTPVNSHSFALRCIPFNSATQKIEAFEFSIHPHSQINEYIDGFFNRYFSGYCESPHTEFKFAINGKAALYPQFHNKEKIPLPIYSYPSCYTAQGPALSEFFSKISLAKNNNLLNAMKLSNYVFSKMRYVKFSTNVSTTAEESFSKLKGVCQDYTHIFLALCRMAKIPCRYCAGLACSDGETHSWAEIFHDGYWYGIDPTNNILAQDGYLKLSHGRDFADCSIDRGIFLGCANQSQTVLSRLTLL